MRRVFFFLTLFVVFIMVLPAIASEVDLSGRYIVEHYSYSNETLNSSDATNSYSSMELMLKPILVINDNIKITAELTALQNHVWGTDAQPRFQQDDPLLPAIDSGNNVDWKAAYVTLKTGIGGFLIGRGIEKRWGTGLGDSTGSHGSNSNHKDGLLWVIPIGNVLSGLGWQHIKENDKGILVSDADFDKTYLFTAYKSTNWHAGLLLARYDHKNFVALEELRCFQRGYAKFQRAVDDYKRTSAVFGYAYKASESLEELGYYKKAGLDKKAYADGYDSVTRWELELPGYQIAGESGGAMGVPDLHELMIDADVAQALATSAGARIVNGPERSILSLWVLDPYIIGDFGSFRVEAEFLYGWGKIDLARAKFNSASESMFNTVDIKGLAGTLGAWRNLGEFTIGFGATYVQGDHDSYEDGKFSGIGYLEPSMDFERGFLLTSDVSQIGIGFAGEVSDIKLGNLSGGPLTVAGTSGYRMFWIESRYSFFDKLEFGVMCVKSYADDPPVGWKNDHGVECDFTLKWNIMKNLVFDGTFAYLDAGNFWEAGSDKKVISNVSALHGRLSFEF